MHNTERLAQRVLGAHEEAGNSLVHPIAGDLAGKSYYVVRVHAGRERTT